ncbi:hypothetical protein CDAR_413001 [Caerostris darwini]|uniref:Uncharacterized protein n=1 Tax=Caerostris darwini TaxID=1538125 RepID=A0AAV4PNJ1_9ARAC|nr:hypothetical protein CDAR_413001 [Caerostris darwini]
MHLPISASTPSQVMQSRRPRAPPAEAQSYGSCTLFSGPRDFAPETKSRGSRHNPSTLLENKLLEDLSQSLLVFGIPTLAQGRGWIIPIGNPSNDDFVPDDSYDEGLNGGPSSWHEMVQYTTYDMILGQYIPFRTSYYRC